MTGSRSRIKSRKNSRRSRSSSSDSRSSSSSSSYERRRREQSGLKRRRTASKDPSEYVPLSSLVGEPSRLAATAVDSLRWEEVERLLTPCIQGRSRDIIVQLVDEELEGMSRKRILGLIEGHELSSSSSSEESEPAVESPARVVMDDDDDEEEEVDRVSVSAPPLETPSRTTSPVEEGVSNGNTKETRKEEAEVENSDNDSDHSSNSNSDLEVGFELIER